MWSVALCFIIALAIVSFTNYIVYRWNNPKCNGTLPPGSMGFPLIGESIQFFIPTKSLDMPGFIKNRIARYGTLFRTSLAGRPIVVSSDPEFNYFIFQQEGKLVQLWYMDSFSSVVGNVFDVTATTYVHKYIKNLVSNHFGTEALKDQLLPQLEEMANQGLRSWSTESSVELKESIASMIFCLSSKLLFSYDGSKNPNHNMSTKLNNFVHCVMSFPLNIPGTAFHRSLKDQKMAIKILKDILHERLTSPAEKRYGDFLDQIVEDMKKEEFLKEEFIVFLMFGILLASFEAISSAITVGMTLLTDHPLVVKELMEENEAILKRREDVNSQLTWKEYKSMTFTSQVINETLRMSSVAPGILRKVIKDIHIKGYVIPEGWTIMVVPSALQMDPEKFKDPLVFNPWRWNEVGANTSLKSFIPFGGGSRNCAGAEFSRVSMAVFLHVLVTKFSWTKIKGANLTRTPALSFGDGFYVKISEKGDQVMK